MLETNIGRGGTDLGCGVARGVNALVHLQKLRTRGRPDLEHLVSSLGVRVSGFGLRASGFEFRVSF